MTEKSLPLQLFEAAQGEARAKWKAVLIDARTNLVSAMNAAVKSWTRESMVELNGAWSLAERVLKEARAVPPPSPVMGSGETQNERLAA